jgi:hypothetical protein
MATSHVAVDEGTADKRVATYNFSEDAVTKEAQRVALNDSAGAEIGTSTSPLAVRGLTVVKDVTLSLDTSAYVAGDVLADSQQVDAALRTSNGTGALVSVVVVDKDDQRAAFTIWFLDANVSMGTENAAPSISDTNAANVLGKVDVAVADYVDLGGVSVAFVAPTIPIPLKAVTGTDDIYVAVVNGAGAPTYTASGVVLRLGIEQN